MDHGHSNGYGVAVSDPVGVLPDEDPFAPAADRPSMLRYRLENGTEAHLLYRGGLHWVFGPHSSGKTFLTQLATLETMFDGGHVVVVDAEDSAPRWRNRLRLLGADDNLIRDRFHKVDAANAVQDPSRLVDTVAHWNARLLLIDGFNQASMFAGVDPNDVRQVARFIARTCQAPARETGVTVVVSDHIGKNSDNATPIGSVHKLNIVDAAAYQIIPQHPITSGARGSSRLVVAKDRPGGLGVPIGTGIASINIDATTPGMLYAHLEQAVDWTATLKHNPTTSGITNRIYNLLIEHPEGLPITTIGKLTNRNTTYLRPLLEKMQDAGMIEYITHKGPRNVGNTKYWVINVDYTPAENTL